MKHYHLVQKLRTTLSKYMFIPPLAATTRLVYWGKFVGKSTFRLANIACAIHLVQEHIGRPAMMTGPSMLPTLAVGGEIAIEDRLTYWFFPQHLGRGDLITLKSPLEPGRVICKRVLGLPGDVICVDPTGEYAPSTEHVVVPKGHVWISGDNAAYSRDSRQYGPVSISLIHGRLLAKVWPPRDATIFRSPITILD